MIFLSDMMFMVVNGKTIYSNKNNGSLLPDCPTGALADLTCSTNCEVNQQQICSILFLAGLKIHICWLVGVKVTKCLSLLKPFWGWFIVSPTKNRVKKSVHNHDIQLIWYKFWYEDLALNIEIYVKIVNWFCLGNKWACRHWSR